MATCGHINYHESCGYCRRWKADDQARRFQERSLEIQQEQARRQREHYRRQEAQVHNARWDQQNAARQASRAAARASRPWWLALTGPALIAVAIAAVVVVVLVVVLAAVLAVALAWAVPIGAVAASVWLLTGGRHRRVWTRAHVRAWAALPALAVWVLAMAVAATGSQVAYLLMLLSGVTYGLLAAFLPPSTAAQMWPGRRPSQPSARPGVESYYGASAPTSLPSVRFPEAGLSDTGPRGVATPDAPSTAGDYDANGRYEGGPG